MLPLQTLGEKMVFSIRGTESTGYLNGKKKIDLDSYLTPYQKIIIINGIAYMWREKTLII